jgi:hypothetical protein
MNPQRALTNVNLFSANIKKHKESEDLQTYRQITDLINIDEDVMYDKFSDDEKGRDDFVKELFHKLYESWNVSVDNIKKIISKFSFDMDKLEDMRHVFEQIHIDKKKKDIIYDTDEKIDPGKKKEKLTKKESKKAKEIDLTETASELISEFISLLNVFTLYVDGQCILTDEVKDHKIMDVDELKHFVYRKETKDIFLKILNGRLTGNVNVPYPEAVIDQVMETMNQLYDKQIMYKIIMSQKKKYYTIHEPDKLLEFINGELKPKEKEKKENGEVFTPLYLVHEMLDQLDEAYTKEHSKSIFSEHHFKWFDPAVGIGNFPVIVYQRLMKGLHILPEEERRKHILENMIYSAELTLKNVFVYKKIFCGDKYKLNIYEGDTLKMDVKKEFGVDKFDVVMGNPPYNASGNTSTGNTIWQEFTKKSLNEWTSVYLLFIHPPGWRKPNTERGKFYGLYNLMCIENQMLYLEIHGVKDGQKMFNCGTRYDWYLIEKTNQYKNTIIVDEDRKKNDYDLSEWSWLPNSNILEINKLLAKKDDERCPIIQSMSAYEPRKKWMSPKKTPEFKYPCVHSTPKTGIRYMYSKVNDRGHFGVSKVIFGDSGIYNPVIDMDGKYGMTQHSMAIQVDNLEEATLISKVIESDKFDKIIQSCLYSSYAIDWNIFKEFKKDFWKLFLEPQASKPIQLSYTIQLNEKPLFNKTMKARKMRSKGSGKINTRRQFKKLGTRKNLIV